MFYLLMNPSRGFFFAFGSFFFGYIFDVTKWTYQIRVPNIERPKMTTNKVITGRPSAWTDRNAAGVRMGARKSKPAMVCIAMKIAGDNEGIDSRLPVL
jgi:hypothetical protein